MATVPEEKPETKEQFRFKAALCAWIIIATFLILVLARTSLEHVQSLLQAEIRVSVGDLGALPLEDAPARFRYDRNTDELVYAGAVGDEAKRALVATVRGAPAAVAAQKSAYLAGVERLAYDSSQRSGALVVALLILGGLAGALGVQLRSIINFVGHTCYRRDLNVPVWWPYYLIRIFTGFLLGGVLVAIVQAGLLTVEGQDTSKVMWWAAVAFLAGFGEDEFTQRLRSISKAIFGETPPPSSGTTQTRPAGATGTGTGTVTAPGAATGTVTAPGAATGT